jgi:hypothetical protein
MKNSFFYCYDKDLMKFLRYEKGIEYNCTGLNTKTKDQFWQFNKSDGTYEAVKEYLHRRSENGGTSIVSPTVRKNGILPSP